MTTQKIGFERVQEHVNGIHTREIKTVVEALEKLTKTVPGRLGYESKQTRDARELALNAGYETLERLFNALIVE